MKTNYSIKNFRAFGEDGVKVPITPITILTGCNSSGKSSIAKSILLLDTFLSKVKKAIESKSKIEFENYALDFSGHPLNLLGRFDKVLNTSSSTGEIEFRYTSKNGLDVILVFVTRKEDALNRGYLKEISIAKGDEEVFKSSEGSCKINMLPFFNEYLEYSKEKINTIDPRINDGGYFAMEYAKSHKISNKSIDWAKDNDSLFHIPLLDKFGHLRKKDFLPTMLDILSKNSVDVYGLEHVLRLINEDFADSEFNTFVDFIKECEKEWMASFDNGIEKAFDDMCKSTSDFPKDWSHADTNIKMSEKVWRLFLKRFVDKKLNGKKLKFPFILTTLVNCGNIIGLPIDSSFGERVSVPEFDDWFSENVYITRHNLWEDFKDYVEKQLQKSLMPEWSSALFYVGSSRVDVRRLYTFDTRNDFSDLLKRYLDGRRDFIRLPVDADEEEYEPDVFLNKWLQRFNICDSASINLDSEGLGVSIKLNKGDDTYLLADEGYGITQLFSILLEIETAIQLAYIKSFSWEHKCFCRDRYTEKILFPEQTIIIEEPEIHLHPKFQSMLADMFAEAMENYNIHFIIETHSEYLIRRIQLRVAEKKIDPKKISVIYVDENKHAYDLGLKDNGKFSEDFGPGFFDEADNAAIQLFELTN
ncbi:MAG: AAA family ATPase [Muribaculaceae bacterium]|nr:AAA family ATPase [Muribaculaceae bacterium]